MQAPPLPAKGSVTQQLPSVQEFPPQQGVRLPGALAVPHLTQRPLPNPELQTRSAVLHRVTPGQQGSPGPPHFWQVAVVVPSDVKQARVASVQRWPGQQGAPITPHLTQLPFALLKTEPVQALSASVQRRSIPETLLLWGQQGSPIWPQPQRPAVQAP